MELFLHEKIIILWYYSMSLSTCSFALVSLHWLSSSGQSFCCLMCWPIWPHSGYLVCPDISSGKSLNCLSNILSILKVISEGHEKSVLNYQWISLYSFFFAVLAYSALCFFIHHSSPPHLFIPFFSFSPLFTLFSPYSFFLFFSLKTFNSLRKKKLHEKLTKKCTKYKWKWKCVYMARMVITCRNTQCMAS